MFPRQNTDVAMDRLQQAKLSDIKRSKLGNAGALRRVRGLHDDTLCTGIFGVVNFSLLIVNEVNQTV